MSAFSSSNLPSTVNTLEKLLIWATNAYYDTASATQTQYTDAITGNLTITQNAIMSLFRDASGNLVYTRTIFIPMDDDLLSGAAKPWTYAREASQVAIPATYNT